MHPAAITKEMKPKGVLRPVIVQLAEASGAYVIVSSKASVTDLPLAGRMRAMADAARDCPEVAGLTLEFYDRNRLATWVRHAGYVHWVRSKIGKAWSGWRLYGSWAHTPEGADPTFLVDDAGIIRTGKRDDGDGLSTTAGINKIREVLRMPSHVVRLVGLSGVGKTRLVEALFDATVGDNSLDPALAIYTDVTEGPDPQPAGAASQLIESRTRAILVIDNCPSDVHRQLSGIARAVGTTISVVTVEYDAVSAIVPATA